MSINLTCHRETLPTSTPVTGVERMKAYAAALEELAEIRDLLRVPSELMMSPRMRRRYEEAVQAVKMYEIH